MRSTLLMTPSGWLISQSAAERGHGALAPAQLPANSLAQCALNVHQGALISRTFDCLLLEPGLHMHALASI